MENKKSVAVLKELYEWIETFLFALAVIILTFTFVVKFVTVSGTSMLQTFQDKDRLFVSDLGYTPKTGDVVVVDVSHNLEGLGVSANSTYIKRVIATEGQTVNIDPVNWRVYVDGEALDEPYVYRADMSPMRLGYMDYPYTVPEGCVFVMGDNRNGSQDSRMIGAIEERYILGRVFLRIIPKPTIYK